MPLEVSAGAIIYREDSGKNLFLLLRYPAINHRSGIDYWDFVKGHVEKDEEELKTVVRETAEETGIKDLEFIDGFSQTMKYFFVYQGRRIFKIVNFRLARTMTAQVALSDEHNDFAWLPYEEAYRALSFDNAKNVLKKAHEFLGKSK